MGRLFLFFVSFYFFLGCRSREEMPADEREIRLVRESSNRAIADHDTASFARTVTVDYHIVSSRNSESSGRVGMRDRFFLEWTEKPDVIYIRTPVSVQTNAAWSMASERGNWVGRWKEGADAIELGGTYYAKWHRSNGHWLIRAEIFVPLTCTGGPYCDKGPI